jgi:hypothetical protein
MQTQDLLVVLKVILIDNVSKKRLYWSFALLIKACMKKVNNNNPEGWIAEGIKRYDEIYATVKKDHKTNKTFTINWLAKRRANLLNAVQTQKRNRLQQQARIELLDSEDDGSGNETASAKINGANRTDNELSDNESDYRYNVSETIRQTSKHH